MKELRVGLITVSDRCKSGETEDKSGHVLLDLVSKHLSPISITSALVPDECDQIESELLHMADDQCVHLILTTGGTGFSPRDVTPEATRKVIHKEAPQMALAMSLISFQKTKFAALSRAVCGIRNKTLICNMPGSPKAVDECFMAIVDVLPHAIDLINDQSLNVRKSHENESQESSYLNQFVSTVKHKHICPHKTGSGAADDRNSPFPMVAVDIALKTILDAIQAVEFSHRDFKSPLNIPEFRASMKDGYAVKANGSCKGMKQVIGYISAGDDIVHKDFDNDSCYKINTGAAVPDFANAIVQVEDTKLIKSENEVEKVVEILIEPTEGLDIRPIGCDLAKGEHLFKGQSDFPDIVPLKSLLASVGVEAKSTLLSEVPICILSTGDELTEPSQQLKPGKIYDSNTTMLRALLEQYGFNNIITLTSSDTFTSMYDAIKTQAEKNQFIICSGSVSMGDKDFLKPVLNKLGFKTHFGRVNMKPGKPMTFADRKIAEKHCCLFGLPGNPVSAFVTFHLFVLPAIRKYCGFGADKLSLPVIEVELLNQLVELDPRPEYARAQILCYKGKFYAEITDNQMSSRLRSIADADVLLHLPERTNAQMFVERGMLLKASILKHHFISKYLEKIED